MGTLFVVATPIGNLEDITQRALRILKEVDIIACEDTRLTKRLLDHYQITTNTISYHQHSKLGKIDFIINQLKEGKDVALVSDAGTPGISDPGGLLVQAAYNEGIKVESVPGPSALIAALSISGLPTDKFNFYGFLPHKKGRQTVLQEIVESKTTAVFYESVHRIEKTLEQLNSIMSGETLRQSQSDKEREIVVARELTKKFETVYKGSIQEVLEKLKQDQVKGEFVVIVSGK